MKFANDQYFELTGVSHAPADQAEWFEIIADEDVDRVKEDWSSILEGKKLDGVQFRLKKQWTNQDGIRSNIWVQSSSYPELDESGKVISRTPCLVGWHTLTCCLQVSWGRFSIYRSSNGQKVCNAEE